MNNQLKEFCVSDTTSCKVFESDIDKYERLLQDAGAAYEQALRDKRGASTPLEYDNARDVLDIAVLRCQAIEEIVNWLKELDELSDQ